MEVNIKVCGGGLVYFIVMFRDMLLECHLACYRNYV